MSFKRHILGIVSLLLYCSCSDPSKPSITVVSLEWNSIDLSSIPFDLTSGIYLEGDAILKRTDSSISILPIHTSKLLIKNGDKEMHIETVPNPLFEESWENLPLDSIPTPLTKDEYIVFQRYTKYKLLNQPISRLLAEEQSFLLDSIQGKTAFLTFWYYGCAPCMAEMEALNFLYQKFENNDQVSVISLFNDSIKEKEGKLLFETKGYSSDSSSRYKPVNTLLPTIGNSKSLASALNVRSYPTHIIIDKLGVIRKIIIGASLDPEINQKNILEYAYEIEKVKTAANIGYK